MRSLQCLVKGRALRRWVALLSGSGLLVCVLIGCRGIDDERKVQDVIPIVDSAGNAAVQVFVGCLDIEDPANPFRPTYDVSPDGRTVRIMIDGGRELRGDDCSASMTVPGEFDTIIDDRSGDRWTVCGRDSHGRVEYCS